MYHTIVRRNILRAFDHLNQADYAAVVRQFAPNIDHWFAGNHALSGRRCHSATAQQWYARLFRLFPGIRFDVKEVLVSGMPWHTRVAVRFDVHLKTPAGEPYENQVAQFISIRWGRITSIALHEDTQKLVCLLQQLAQAGQTEAMAEPIEG